MYGELIVCINMVFNYAILSFANQLAHVYSSRKRIIFASFVGAVLVVLAPSSIVLFFCSFFIMTTIAFGKSFAMWKKASVFVWIGALFAGGFLTVIQPYIQRVPSNLTLIPFIVLAFIALYALRMKWMSGKSSSHLSRYTHASTLHLWDVEIQLQVFVDTGNSCSEPLSGKPVHFVSFEQVQHAVPTQLLEALGQWNPKKSLSMASFPASYQKDLRLIQVQTVQGVSWAIGIHYEQWIIGDNNRLPQGFIILTKNARRFPTGAGAILHESALEFITNERGSSNVARV